MSTLRRLTSLPTLLWAFVVVTLVEMGPFRDASTWLHRYWAKERAPWALDVLNALDTIAGQGVALPVLLGVALWAARRMRSWRPLLVVGLVEAAFFGGIGGMKILFARPSPAIGDPDFFDGGIFELGWHGISYPSGHASEAVLLYGAALYLLQQNVALRQRTLNGLVAAWAGIVLLATSISFVLGYHWIGDLVGGAIAGGIMLHLVVRIDRWWARRQRTRARRARAQVTAPADRTPAVRG